MPSTAAIKKNIIRVSAKLIKLETFAEKRNIYLGAFVLEIIPAFAINADIPAVVELLKKPNISWPENT